MENKKFDVWEHFYEHEGWTCKLCDKEIECSESKLKYHMETKHKIKFKED